jgi:hypothetical protein
MNPPSEPRTKQFTRVLSQLWQRVIGAADLGLSASGEVTRKSANWVPIRSLSSRHKPRIARHLRALPAQDRYLRFGYAATDEQIDRYVAGLNFKRD